jgi:hypothetical protein
VYSTFGSSLLLAVVGFVSLAMNTCFGTRGAGTHLFHFPSVSGGKSSEGTIIAIVAFFAVIGRK